MSEMPDHGGAAFPVTLPSGPTGMSLRDWFAGQALAGLLANPHCRGIEDSAIKAFKIADAMMLELLLERTTIKR